MDTVDIDTKFAPTSKSHEQAYRLNPAIFTKMAPTHCSRSMLGALKAAIAAAAFVACASCDKSVEQANPVNRAQENLAKQNDRSAVEQSKPGSTPSASSSASHTVLIRSARSKSQDQTNDFKIELGDQDGRFHTSSNFDDISALPVTKRMEIVRIREARKALDAERDNAIESREHLTTQIRMELRAEWNRKHQEEYGELAKREEIARRSATTVTPIESEIDAVTKKLNASVPTFTENDMPVLEYLIPGTRDLVSKHQREDSSIRQMLAIYRQLAMHFPQSVNRPELVQLAKTAGL